MMWMITEMMTMNDIRQPAVCVRFNDRELQMLLELCEREAMKRSEYIRMLIRREYHAIEERE